MKKNHSKTRLYGIWNHIKTRCLKKYDDRYKDYGGRGITICKEWLDYENFYNWAINNGYKNNLSIDRINNNGNYEPCNCRWATPKEQSQNTRRNRLIEYNGQKKCLALWAEELKMSYELIRSRLRRSWTIEEALTTPKNENRASKKEGK